MNKTATKIVRRDGLFRFETRICCTYNPRIWRMEYSAWLPECDGDTLLNHWKEEEQRIAPKVAALDATYVSENSEYTITNLPMLANYVAACITKVSGKKLSIKFKSDSLSYTFNIRDLNDARVALATIMLVFRAPSCPDTIGVMLHHLIRQRVFDILHADNFIGAARLVSGD